MKRAKIAKHGKNVRRRFARAALASRGALLGRGAVPLGSMLISGGHERRTDAAYDWRGLDRGPSEFALFQFTLQGAGRLRHERTEYAVGPGRAMVLHFPHDNRYWFDPARADAWRFFYLCLNGSELLRLWRAGAARGGPLLNLGMGHPLADRAAGVCLDVMRGRFRSPYAASEAAYGVAMGLWETVGRPGRTAARDPAGPRPKTRPAAVARAIALVHDRYAEPIGVDAMAHAAGYSRFHFTRLFTDSEGLSPHQYLLRHRLREAARRLQTTDLPIKAVARSTGFRDANYFGKAFVKAYGLTPGAMRRGGMV